VRRPRTGSTRPRALRARGPWTPPKPAGPGVQVIIEVEGSDGEVHEIRRGRNGVVYCTCPAWAFNRETPKTCKHLRRYHDELATNPIGSASLTAPWEGTAAAAPVAPPIIFAPSPVDRAVVIVRSLIAVCPGRLAVEGVQLRAMAEALVPHLAPAPVLQTPVAPVRRRLFLEE